MVYAPDVNVGPADYKNDPGSTLRVAKIFYTLQGEGPYTGQRAVFVRLGGCNRGSKDMAHHGCEFCDAAFEFAKSTCMSYDSLWSFMNTACGGLLEVPETSYGNRPLIVITGGEPMIQDNLSEFLAFLNDKKGMPHVQIESNGDRLAKGYERHHAVLVVSPKVYGDGKYRPLRDDVFEAMEYLKILVSADPTSPYHNLHPDLARIDGDYPVYLSPIVVYKRNLMGEGEKLLIQEADGMGIQENIYRYGPEIGNLWDHTLVDVPATRKNIQYAVELCKKHPYTLNLQTHLLCAIE